MNIQTRRGSIRFRPVDKEDFSARARAYQRLIGVKLSQAQELLSRIYGYADFHELQFALSRPEEAGPFDDDEGVRARADPEARRLRLVAVTAHYKARSGQQDWDWLGGVGLFCTPAEFRHRQGVVQATESAAIGGQ